MMAHEVESVIGDLKRAQKLIRIAVKDIECDAKEKAEIEEWLNEVENAISEISAIAKKQKESKV